MRSIIESQLKESQQILNRFLETESALQNIEKAASLLIESLKSGGKAISCGNGGSHSDAMHFAEEMTGRYREDRPPMAAICISDPAHITCVGNDFGFDYIFSRYLQGVGKSGDVLLALSTSGNSPNIIRGLDTAKEIGMSAILLTGADGGNAHGLADVEINVPHDGYADRIQEVHIKIIHILILLVENSLHPTD